MPEESRTEDFETVLAEEKVAEDRKNRLVADLLKQREAASKDFDEKLAKLGYHPAAKRKRNYHRKSAAPAASWQKDKAKAWRGGPHYGNHSR
jgi:hypothetical protein